ncbi:hypothetical protein PIROE2DRAFT_1794, partial [Piromyces sp. E2]
CIDNISKINLDLNSNNFLNNKAALNGGALYLKDGVDLVDNDNDIINFENNIFSKNSAENFGGAIYSEFSYLYLATSKNNEITYNDAGIMGGGIFSPQNVKKTIFNMDNFKIENNTVNFYINNHTSNPTYIALNTELTNENLNIVTGDHFPLEFTLYDEYYNIVEDITRYYSSMTLKLTLEEENPNQNYEDNENKNSINYKLIGNIGSFVKGQCKLNNLIIYANPNTYKVKLIIENYNGNLHFMFDDIIINVKSCDSDIIKMYDKNNILYCENPKCKDQCPVDSSAVCKAYQEEGINDINKNICECLPGWEGDNCERKIYIDFSSLENAVTVFNIIMLLILITYIIFITVCHKQSIISNIGYELGIINEADEKFRFISSYISSRSISSIDLKSSTEINQSNVNLDKERSNASTNLLSNGNDSHRIENYKSNERDIKNISNKLLSREDITNRCNENSNAELPNKNKGKRKKNKHVIKCIRNAHSIFIEVLFVYPLYVISLTIVTLWYKIKDNNNSIDDDHFIQSDNGQWFYQCDLVDNDIIYYLLELILLIFILIKGIKILNYECVFKCTKYIIYSVIVDIALGPIVNV